MKFHSGNFDIHRCLIFALFCVICNSWLRKLAVAFITASSDIRMTFIDTSMLDWECWKCYHWVSTKKGYQIISLSTKSSSEKFRCLLTPLNLFLSCRCWCIILTSQRNANVTDHILIVRVRLPALLQSTCKQNPSTQLKPGCWYTERVNFSFQLTSPSTLHMSPNLFLSITISGNMAIISCDKLSHQSSVPLPLW